jgi:hypothetical protein
MSKQLGHQQTGSHLLQQFGKAFTSGMHQQIVRPPALPVDCIPSLRAE